VFNLFQKWYLESSRQSSPVEGFNSNVATLATSTPDGRPSARIVLFKGMEGGLFTFYTNYHSRKAIEIQQNPRVALVFHWPNLIRQIRVEGMAARLSADVSDRYWRTRARGSQLGAMAVEQSSEIQSRDELLKQVERLDQQFLGAEIPRPDYWGGFGIEADRVEFWQGKENRLHERDVFIREPKDALPPDAVKWKRVLLGP